MQKYQTVPIHSQMFLQTEMCGNNNKNFPIHPRNVQKVRTCSYIDTDPQHYESVKFGVASLSFGKKSQFGGFPSMYGEVDTGF